MWPSVRHCQSPKLRSFAALILLAASSSLAVASDTPKVIVRESITKRHRTELENKLKAITGWHDLRFTLDGALVVGTNRQTTGSNSARELLNKAVSGNRIILFEDATGRKDVGFCRVGLGALVGEMSPLVFVVLIDFDDFKQVSGDRQARAAFDVGWAVLHELDHVVEDSADPEIAGVSGDCEQHINRMRQELNLPVRTDYYYSFLPVKSDLSLISKFVRLGFHSRDQVSGKTKRYWLLWDAALVGGLPSNAQTASLF